MQPFLQTSGITVWGLPVLILWPVVAAIGIRLIGRDPTSVAEVSTAAGWSDARRLTTIALVIEWCVAMLLAFAFNPSSPDWQARFDQPWLPAFGASISLGIDGLSLTMILLTATLLPAVVVAAWDSVRVRTPSFGALLLLLTSGMIGVFCALDLLVFYLAWELMLIPTYLLLGVWGVAGQGSAAIRYVLFTLVGSLLMLVAIITMGMMGTTPSLHLDDLTRLSMSPGMQQLLFLAFLAAFGVKSAIVPFHTWLPGAQSAAPTVAAITVGLKVGVFALLRFALPLFPAAAGHPAMRQLLLGLGVVSVLYGAMVALGQHDLKRVISFSAISHMGFILIGCMAFTPQAVGGAVVSMVASGLGAAVLFVLAGHLEDQVGTTHLAQLGGMARQAPWFAAAFLVGVLSTVALPGTVGFVGEFLVLVGSFPEQPWIATLATVGVVLAAGYGLRATQRVLWGITNSPDRVVLIDLPVRARFMLGLLSILILVLGIAPASLLRLIETPVRDVVTSVRFGPAGTLQAPMPTEPR